MGHAALRAMRVCAAKLLLVNDFVGHGFHHVGARYEHVALLVDHENEVGKRRRVARPAGTRAENGRELGNHS